MNPLDSNVEPVGAASTIRFREAFGVRCVPVTLWRGQAKSDAGTRRTPKLAQKAFRVWLRERTVSIDAEHFGAGSFAVGLRQIA